MSGDSKKTISYAVENEEAKAYWNYYARVKGFKSAGALGRVALVQYGARHPLKPNEQAEWDKLRRGRESPGSVQSCAAGEGTEGDQ